MSQICQGWTRLLLSVMALGPTHRHRPCNVGCLLVHRSCLKPHSHLTLALNAQHPTPHVHRNCVKCQCQPSVCTLSVHAVSPHRAKLTLCTQQPERTLPECSTLFHPHITTISDAIATPSFLCLVSEHVEGGTLASYVTQRGQLSEKVAKFLFQQLCMVLSFCHHRGVALQHLTPDTVIVDWCPGKLPVLKLADCGFATGEQVRAFFVYPLCCGATSVVQWALYAGPALCRASRRLPPWSLPCRWLTPAAGGYRCRSRGRPSTRVQSAPSAPATSSTSCSLARSSRSSRRRGVPGGHLSSCKACAALPSRLARGCRAVCNHLPSDTRLPCSHLPSDTRLPCNHLPPLPVLPAKRV